jgi:hypothetical protein
MAATYLERYHNGERDQVWQELVNHGAAIRTEPLYSEAQAVAREMMQRARHNVALIDERLQRLGFRFLDAQSGWMPPDDVFLEDLASLEYAHGLLLLVLSTWFEIVGQVCWMGDHPRLSCYYANAGPMSDPLVVGYSGYDVRCQAEEAAEEEAEAQHQRPRRRARHRLYSFDIAPDACLKSHFSGGGPTCFKVPNPGFDGPLMSPDEWDGMFFVPYLCGCFAWGGFPGLRHNAAAAEAAQADLAVLTSDLLSL